MSDSRLINLSGELLVYSGWATRFPRPELLVDGLCWADADPTDRATLWRAFCSWTFPQRMFQPGGIGEWSKSHFSSLRDPFMGVSRAGWPRGIPGFGSSSSTKKGKVPNWQAEFADELYDLLLGARGTSWHNSIVIGNSYSIWILFALNRLSGFCVMNYIAQIYEFCHMAPCIALSDRNY